MKIDSNLAAVCGLFCGTCPSYINQICEGCLSDNCHCDCMQGFQQCVKQQAITRCYECAMFPCKQLMVFSTKHIVNGICHHQHIILDLIMMKEFGTKWWIADQIKRHTCPNCDHFIPWYEVKCPCKEKNK